VLAGGRGTRLAPYTSVLPKPLMPVGERAILELVVDQLALCGITDITVCVGHLAHLIKAVLDERRDERVSIRYVHEDDPLGTTGPLRLVPGLDDTFLVMNGDVLTDLDYADLLRAHGAAGNAVTIAAHERSVDVDYGVLHLDRENGRVEAYEEKPQTTIAVSMGVYVLEPRALDHVPPGYFDFPDLVQALLAAGEPVGAYRFDGLWFDIGRKDDYELAVSTWGESGGTAPRVTQLRKAAE
jgi:NDP-sugar pyrophosphorylase family protein